jgi:hypothetical protein
MDDVPVAQFREASGGIYVLDTFLVKFLLLRL